MSTYEELSELVEEAYDFRNHYFRNHRDGTDETRRVAVYAKLDEVIEKIDGYEAVETEPEMKMSLLKAKALNIYDEYQPDAERLLITYVDRFQYNMSAWNLLGECFYKKKDYYNARYCFEGSLKVERNVCACRFLSMLWRRDPDPSHIKESFSTSIELAREAVAMDLSNGISWSVLGNAYLASFFSNRDNAVLKQALRAFSKGAQYDDIDNSPDFHFNRAVASMYYQDFENAFVGFEQAIRYSSYWEKPQNHLDSLKSFLASVCECIANKGKVKRRKLRQLLSSFTPEDLGSYADGIPKRQGDKVVYVPSILANLAALEVGRNIGKIITGKVVCQVFAPEQISFTFCIVDVDETCMAVNVYNMAQGRGVVVGDTVTIPEPLVENFSVTYKENTYNFQWIRIDNPLYLIVNGRPVKSDWQAAACA